MMDALGIVYGGARTMRAAGYIALAVVYLVALWFTLGLVSMSRDGKR